MCITNCSTQSFSEDDNCETHFRCVAVLGKDPTYADDDFFAFDLESLPMQANNCIRTNINVT